MWWLWTVIPVGVLIVLGVLLLCYAICNASARRERGWVSNATLYFNVCDPEDKARAAELFDVGLIQARDSTPHWHLDAETEGLPWLNDEEHRAYREREAKLFAEEIGDGKAEAEEAR